MHAAVVRRPLPTASLPTRDENCGHQERPEAVDVGRSAGRTLALPQEVEHWSLTTLRDKPVKIGAKVVRHGRYATFQLAEVAVPRTLFADMLRLIGGLRPRAAPT